MPNNWAEFRVWDLSVFQTLDGPMAVIDDRMENNIWNMWFDHWHPVYEELWLNMGDKILLEYPGWWKLYLIVKWAAPKTNIPYRTAWESANLVNIHFMYSTVDYPTWRNIAKAQKDRKEMKVYQLHLAWESWKEGMLDGEEGASNITISNTQSRFMRGFENFERSIGNTVKNALDFILSSKK